MNYGWYDPDLARYEIDKANREASAFLALFPVLYQSPTALEV